MKKIIVTGSNGLLGQKVTELSIQDPEIELIATSIGPNRHNLKDGYTYEELDVLDLDRLNELVEIYQPDSIIHTAAMTNVDACEAERAKCYALNVQSVKNLVDVCERKGIQLVHLSTDFIFDGENGPYTEEAEPNPLSYYGETKLESELILKNSSCRWAILRTIIVYGVVNDMSRSNIVLWAKGALEKGEPIHVVNDQWRMPTLAEDLAACCLLAVKKNASGVFNVSGKDLMSILEIVERVADHYGLNKSLINQAAKRPKKTGFILDKAIVELGYSPHSFEEGMAFMDKQLKSLS
jgi:dTDP-4-dehydrorhamnose reductase